MTKIKTLSIAALAGFWAAAAAAHPDHDLGHGPLDIFNSDALAAMPITVKIWMGILAVSLASGVFFVRKHKIARWIVCGFLISIFTGDLFFRTLDLPMLSGAVSLWHLVCWSPGLFLLLIRRPFLREYEPYKYRIWTAVVAFVIVVSFLYDIRDAAVYIGHVTL